MEKKQDPLERLEREFFGIHCVSELLFTVNVDSGLEFYRVVFIHSLRYTTVSFLPVIQEEKSSTSIHC